MDGETRYSGFFTTQGSVRCNAHNVNTSQKRFTSMRRARAVAEDADLVLFVTEVTQAEPDRNWSEDGLVAPQLEPSTVRGAFKRHLGMTFLDLVRHRQAGRRRQHDRGAAQCRIRLHSGFRGATAQLISNCASRLRGRELLKADWSKCRSVRCWPSRPPHAPHLAEFVDRKALPAEFTHPRKGRAPPSPLGWHRFGGGLWRKRWLIEHERKMTQAEFQQNGR